VADDSDYIRLRGHINRLKSEFAALDPELIERICQHLIVVRRSRPTFKKMRAYVAELTSDHDEPTLRGMLGLPPASSTRAPSGRRRTAPPESGDGARAIKRSGRPGWTAQLFWDRYREACEQVGPPHAHKDIAGSFRGLDGERGIDPDHFRRLLRRFGLPPA
jgi:hypothetical protein